jgi:cellulose synthase/poly-beta-1,6-N-acetylglucosamine synthase-like glycosyltransferase
VVDYLLSGWRLVTVIPGEAIFSMLWLTLVVEAPRYFIGLQATASMLLLRERREHGPIALRQRVSILVAGHNEEGAVEKCIRSLYQQTFLDFEIVCVDDGSNDRTYEIMDRLRRENLVASLARLELRGGKAAALNLAARLAKGDIFIVIDCDCSFEPNALEELLRPFIADPEVAGVSGNILVRNWRYSIVTSLQAIEYLLSISLGKSFSDILDQVSCVSGAFGAFRRDAWDRVNGMDVGGGEDLDFTLRLRSCNYKIAFARHSICYTDVPHTFYDLWRQRNRWERDAIWVRFRKHRRLMDPSNSRFDWREALHQWDFIVFNMLPAFMFPFYMAWLLTNYGPFGLVVLIAIAFLLSLADVASFFVAVLVTGKPVYYLLAPFVPLFGLFQSYVMRSNRLYAYVTEIVFSSSLQDNYVPQKSRDLMIWR